MLIAIVMFYIGGWISYAFSFLSSLKRGGFFSEDIQKHTPFSIKFNYWLFKGFPRTLAWPYYSISDFFAKDN